MKKQRVSPYTHKRWRAVIWDVRHLTDAGCLIKSGNARSK